MPLILLAVALVACFLLLWPTRNGGPARAIIVNSFLVVGAVLVGLTEALSFFGRLDRAATVSAWAVVATLFCVVLVYRRLMPTARRNTTTDGTKAWVAHSWRRVAPGWSRSADIIALALSGLLALGLFAVALTITNNYDSYSYHLPRVEQWIQNRNVSFFPTNFIPQVARTPLAEYVIAHLRLLAGSNGANNFVQYSSYLLSAIAISLIALQLGGSGRQQFYAAIIGLTVPMAMLQAETTQTDLVVSFLVLACVYYCIKVVATGVVSISDLCFVSLSIALGMLAKGTFYLFAFPFCVWFALVLLRRHRDRLVASVLTLLVSVALIDGPFFYRNYATFGSPFGPGGALSEGILNEKISVTVIGSNMIKDVSLHLTSPFESWNRRLVAVVRQVHRMMGYSVDDPKSTWYGPYRLMFLVWHDVAGAFFHLVLALWAGLALITMRTRVNRLRFPYYCCSVGGFLVFFAVLKWQLFNTRLDVVGVLLLAPIIVLALPGWAIRPSSVALLIVGNLIVYQAQWGGKAILSKEFRSYRGEATYALNYEAARNTTATLKQYGVEKVGFALHGNFPEWSYWLTRDSQEFRHVLFPALVASVPNFDSGYRYRALIIDKTCTVNGGDGCLVGGALNRFIANNSDIALAEEFPNNSTLVIFKHDQSKLFLY